MNTTLEVYLAYPKDVISQKFGANANPLYAGDGLKGHTAYDWDVAWDTPIPNCTANAYCYSILNKDNPDLMRYRSIYMLVEAGGALYEVSYGHCHTIFAEVGKTYQVGESIGTVGNTGDVYAGNHYVTEAEKEAGSHAGRHLHGPQLRPVRLVSRRSKPTRWYLQDANGFLKRNGQYVEVLNYDNGYNGCVNWAPFSTETVATLQAPVRPATPMVDQNTVQVLQRATDAIESLPRANQPYFLGILTSILKVFGLK